MLEFLRTYQTNIMFVLSGICGMIALFACITKYPSRTRKISQIVMAASAMLLLITEILGEAYYGNTTAVGYWMVRICNFFVYLTTLLMIHTFMIYLEDMFRVDLKLPVPRPLKVTSWFIFIGDQILSKINKYAYLSAAARYHHEPFDGTGYPDGLKGEEIPELARIISVADAYDAMTSNRSYRSHLSQEAVRQEFIRCSGTQFDPQFAQIILQMIQQDPGYTMREN